MQTMHISDVVEYFDEYSKKQTFGNATTPITQRGVDTWKRVLVARQIISRTPRTMGVM